MLKFINLASGSKGNTSLFYDDDFLFVIDFGTCKKTLVDGLKLINKKLSDVDSFFFTHNHIDHIKGLNFIDTNKVYALKGTLNLDNYNYLEYYKEYNIKNVLITPLKTSHDANNPLGYLFKYKDEELVYITDTGVIPLKTLNLIQNKEYYIFESNHDIKLLLQSNRSLLLKDRILSTLGHLSNDLCSFYLGELIGKRTKKILLAHLSEECNSDDIALDTLCTYLDSINIDRSNIDIDTLKQHSVTTL